MAAIAVVDEALVGDGATFGFRSPGGLGVRAGVFWLPAATGVDAELLLFDGAARAGV